MDTSILIFFLIGAFGALTKDLIHDNTLSLPNKSNGQFYAGFLGGTIIGGIAGVATNEDPMRAFLAGYAGTSIIENLVPKKATELGAEKTAQEIIKLVAKEEGIDPDLAIRVARCENAKFDPYAINTNMDGSRDRGIFQINDKWHPHVTDEQAFDPWFSARFFAKAVKDGNIHWWKASKKCWDI